MIPERGVTRKTFIADLANIWFLSAKMSKISKYLQ
jgi:hypothetical protein